MKNSIKRAQSQACLGFAERKNFRPLAKLKKLSLTLALLLTAATGAWADGDTKYTLTFKANGNTKTVENVTLPKTFSCNVDDETGRGTDELDVIIQELYGLSGNYCLNTAPNSDNASVTCGMDDADLQYIIVNAPFNGTATVTGKYIDTNYSVFDYSLEITLAEAPIEVTTNAASKQDLFTTASFKMPTSDVTVNYTLVRDMQDETNPVTFSGLPTNDEPIIVKKGSDGKYQPAEELNIQLIDPLAAAEAQNIIAADGITVKVLVGDDSSLPIEYDQDNPITLEAFLADMKPGYYWIKAEPTDENSPYDGTVYSSQFTVVEQYDLTVKPANDFSKGKIESVTVGTETVTPDATTGEATKTGVAPDTEVKLKAKRGYVIEKVEVKKGGPTKTINIEGIELIYSEGDKWEKIVEKNPDHLYIENNKIWSRTENAVLSVGQNSVLPTDIIDTSKEYWWDY